MTNEEILRALQRILERWSARQLKSDEARSEVDKVVFGSLFSLPPKDLYDKVEGE